MTATVPVHDTPCCCHDDRLCTRKATYTSQFTRPYPQRPRRLPQCKFRSKVQPLQAMASRSAHDRLHSQVKSLDPTSRASLWFQHLHPEHDIFGREGRKPPCTCNDIYTYQ